MSTSILRPRRTFTVRWAITSLTVVFFSSIAAAVSADSAFFIGLGDLPGGAFLSQPYDVSADGSVVVGVSDIGGSNAAFRWTRSGGMIDLGIANVGVPRVSADGSTVINAGGNVPPIRWTEATGPVVLPIGQARGVSGDGSIVVGQMNSTATTRQRAVRWSVSGGAELLFDDLQIDSSDSLIAWDVSANGAVIFADKGSQGPFIWSVADGYRFLGPGLAIPSESYSGISDDGAAVFGYALDPARPFRWTQATGVVELGVLPDGVGLASSRGISADGSTIVGNASSVDGMPQRAYIWDVAHGSRYLLDVLVDEAGLGSALEGWTLGVARGLSGDGRHIVGYGTNPDGNTEAWIAFLGTPSPSDYDGSGAVDGNDFLTWQRGHSPHPLSASELSDWQTNFGAGSVAGASQAVPEPSAISAVTIAVASAIGRRRIRRTAIPNTV